MSGSEKKVQTAVSTTSADELKKVTGGKGEAPSFPEPSRPGGNGGGIQQPAIPVPTR